MRYLLHLDLDMYFAAVELRAQPQYRHEPVIVGNKNARITRKGVVQTANYIAREYGIHSGMSMHEALNRCPQAKIIREQGDQYRPTSRRIMAILKSYDVPVRVTSIDEAYMDLTPICSSFAEGGIIGKLLKSQIYEQEQLTCSIGIGPTLKVAKMSSDYDKPDGLTVVRPDRLHEFFRTRSLRDIPGIGKVSAQKLKNKGFSSCENLVDRSRYELVELLGSTGDFLYRVFRGKTTNVLRERGERKSISHERTFHGEPGDIATYTEKLEYLLDKTIHTLQVEGFLAKTLTVKIRFNGFDTITRSSSLQVPTSSKEIFEQLLTDLTVPYLHDERGIRLLGVGVSNLSRVQRQQTSLTQYFPGSSIPQH